MATTSAAALLVALVVLAGLADLQAATAAPRPVHAAELSVPARTHPMTRPELEGMMECLMGCVTTVMSCVMGCMGKPPMDMPLCFITCDQKYIMGMIKCGLTPSPPAPKPPVPPKPPAPPAMHLDADNHHA